ncbi:hypothetical protein FHS16_005684 [Paenibacillus endophyticus]|uniref:Uncharacterized protein n=1 Tax=Paenibacillus endophyticus TaxID=1294268 RepID=A0A7W5GD55_9BACL|nr:hypothetical protein [Paenibacillus endophyticus]
MRQLFFGVCLAWRHLKGELLLGNNRITCAAVNDILKDLHLPIVNSPTIHIISSRLGKSNNSNVG